MPHFARKKRFPVNVKENSIKRVVSKHMQMFRRWSFNLELSIACFAVVSIASGLLFHLVAVPGERASERLYQAVLLVGGLPLVVGLIKKLLQGIFGSDLLAGISIVTSALLGEYLAGAFVVLMLSGGEALERYALSNASSALKALSKRMPHIAHRRVGQRTSDIQISEVVPGDTLVIFPHEVCPADGIVIEGRSSMDESYLTGEPYQISKTVGAAVISGAKNGESPLTITVSKAPKDSRYAKVIEVMRRAEQEKPALRRLGDVLGAWYTPLALLIAIGAWWRSGESVRFLSVLVIATPCPLLIAIPIAIIGGISLSAKRGIIIRNPSVMEQLPQCDIVVLDKTGTLTIGAPTVTDIKTLGLFTKEEVLILTASLEQYSKHPLSQAVVSELTRRELLPLEVSELSERPGEGLSGIVAGRNIKITSRKKLQDENALSSVPHTSGLECVVLIDGVVAGLVQFHDSPRRESSLFVRHLNKKHKVKRVMIVSGDRESEVKYLADEVGIKEVYASQSPEQKVSRVRELNSQGKVLFVGDGINDAPALSTAHVGVAMGHANEATSDAAGAVILEASLSKLDELMHISGRMRRIALESALGGMVLSIGGMALAFFGFITPVAGAVTQEIIDVLSVLNALRSVAAPKTLTDLEEKVS